MGTLTGEFVASTYQKLLQIGTTSTGLDIVNVNERVLDGLGKKQAILTIEKNNNTLGGYVMKDSGDNQIYMKLSAGSGPVSLSSFGEILFEHDNVAPLYIISAKKINTGEACTIKIQTRPHPDDIVTKTGDILLHSGSSSLDPDGSNIILISENSRYFIGKSPADGIDKLPPYTSFGATVSLIGLDDNTGQIYRTVKSFVIDNPNDESKYLVHACIEGPEVAVYYRGESQLIDGEVEVELPNYFESLTHVDNRTIQLTPITNESGLTDILSTSKIKDGKFKVNAILKTNPNQEFYWEVKAERKDIERIEVEPNKSDYSLMGDGPYTYLVKK
jgi:hypothetical protein